MDPLLFSALGVVAGGVISAAVTMLTKRGDRTDHAIDSLLASYRSDIGILQTKVLALEGDRETDRREMSRLREMLSEQSMELFIIRARELDLRAWAREISAWCAMAVGLIQSLGGQITEPPPLPHVYPTDFSEEKAT